MTQQELQNNFGHKIDVLMRHALDKRLNIEPLVASEIMLLAEAHTKHWPRYPRQEGKPVFVIDGFEPYVLELLKAVASSIRGPDLLPPYVSY